MIIEVTCTPDERPVVLELLNAAFEVRTVLQERTGDALQVTVEVQPRTAEITPDIAAHVLWHFDVPGGYAPGSFTKDLVMLIARADPPNRARLALGHPAYVAAVTLAQDTVEGAARLQAIAALKAAAL